MNFYILCLYLFNFIAEFGYVIGQVSKECKIYNSLKNLPDTNCCTPQKVCSGKTVCDKNGFVQCLDLTKSSLTIIPEDVRFLVHLKYLYLGDNNIKSVPEFILNLEDLQILGLNDNNFNEVPEVITKLPNLNTLILKNNVISELTPSIRNVKSLEYLGMQNNQLSSLPKEIGYLPSIKNINLLSNKIKVVPDEIGKLNTLNILYLYNNQIETIPSSIGNLDQLEFLDLGNNSLLKNIPPEIFNLRNLKKLLINRCPKLDVKVIKFPNVLEKCYFYETNISCYQPGTCNTIMMDDGSNNNNITITEAEFLKNTRECTEQEIISVKQGTNDSSSNTLIYICIIVGVILIIVIIVSIWYINYYKRKINKNIEKKLINKSSDVIIYEKHQATPEMLATLVSLTTSETPVEPAEPAASAAPTVPTTSATLETQESPLASMSTALPISPTLSTSSTLPISPALPISPSSSVSQISPASSTLPSSSIPLTTNINIILPVPINVIPSLSYMPIQTSEPPISYEQLMSDKIQNHVELNMSNNKKCNRNEKQLLENNVNESPSPPYSRY